MIWWMIVILAVSGYIVGWFTTALAITQIGTVKRGCIPGCPVIRNPRYDAYYDSREPRFLGTHLAGCHKPHFELVTATEAAQYALVWPYLWFYGALALSEKKAHQRVEAKASRDAKKSITPEQLANIDKVLENPNVVMNPDGSIRVVKELTDG